MRTLLFAVSLLGLTACGMSTQHLDYQRGDNITEQEMKAFVAASTTSQQLKSELGAPDMVVGDTWRYHYILVHADAAQKSVAVDTVFEFVGESVVEARKEPTLYPPFAD
ncbi:hypothetical protein [Enterovibrio norvegicus]|uniref:hypothetical protein n=1 Tax=Enterovibrio norvegicus TaxID=188144 RepID=UPI00352E1798